MEQATQVPLSSIRGILVPGLAFDRRGHRLGRGRAFYDRCLKNFTALKVGVGFNLQIRDELPHEDHDIKMNWLITENEKFQVAA